jgi:hypothetical protein
MLFMIPFLAVVRNPTERWDKLARLVNCLIEAGPGVVVRAGIFHPAD